MAPKKASKVAPPPKAATATKKQSNSFHAQHKHLFPSTPKNFGIGRALPPKKDLSRVVRWPLYVRLQRQSKILKQRLKVPPAINQFTMTVDKNMATNVLKLLAGYSPESPAEKKQRRLKAAEAEAKGDVKVESKKPMTLKYGINHVTKLVEEKKAKLVVIAHDVDPIEIVVWLPALCRRMDVPYLIIKGKARLGKLVHKKTCTAVALTEVRKEDQAKLDQIISNARAMFNDNVAVRRNWGGNIMGIKAQHVMKKREQIRLREAAAKAKAA